MTRLKPVRITCRRCGTTNRFAVISTLYNYGASDLDLRPGPMERGTLFTLIQECPACGYISYRISDEIPNGISEKWYSSDEYRSCNGIQFKSSLAKQFYKYFLTIMQKADFGQNIHEMESAFETILHAAWSCDDYSDTDNAIECRKKAITIGKRLINRNFKREYYEFILVDLLRRTRQFDQLLRRYRSFVFSNDSWNTALRFQIQRARENDDTVHSFEELYQ